MFLLIIQFIFLFVVLCYGIEMIYHLVRNIETDSLHVFLFTISLTGILGITLFL